MERVGRALAVGRVVRFRNEQHVVGAIEPRGELREVGEVDIRREEIERWRAGLPHVEQMRQRSAARILAGLAAGAIQRDVGEHRQVVLRLAGLHERFGEARVVPGREHFLAPLVAAEHGRPTTGRLRAIRLPAREQLGLELVAARGERTHELGRHGLRVRAVRHGAALARDGQHADLVLDLHHEHGVLLASTLRRYCMNAPNARASASRVAPENAERISTPDPSATCTRGKRADRASPTTARRSTCCSSTRRTTGSRACRSCARASRNRSSTVVQSNFPSMGSMSSHDTGASTVLRFIAFSRGQCGFMYAAFDALEFPSSPPRISMGLPSTMSCCVVPCFSRCGAAEEIFAASKRPRTTQPEIGEVFTRAMLATNPRTRRFPESQAVDIRCHRTQHLVVHRFARKRDEKGMRSKTAAAPATVDRERFVVICKSLKAQAFGKAGRIAIER